ncbi:GlxA family transcriptional regulator [Nitrospirillum pindoramense]|uniref:AraC family transcriptional regulator with amidase-like domain n=1 Tax=Nitrospirillum amazonense TaxID=28077 RepID=A0A560HK92_9PROT|nr:GlxA family transcriptional regulator [Nitrospirillum amazonense]TWB45949.1 AraC family transcriptional regulator with amidase-like domain [Nitrospirillum amazonense]
MARTIAFLAYPGFQILDVTGPLAAFEIAGRCARQPYDIRVMALEAGPVASSSGVLLMAGPLVDPAQVDTLVVAGGDGVNVASAEPVLLDYARAVAERARRVTSVCSGTFLLAAAGLLDGRRVTTHWYRTSSFARRFPQVRLEADRIFIRDGAYWTSAGITAGIDLALALVAEDQGEAIARRTARQLVVPYRRQGGQSQFSTLLEMQGASSRFGDLLAWVRDNLSRPLTVEDLAAQAAMSPRNFARAFAAEQGVTPAKAVEQLRLEVARDLVEESPASLDRIALETGFGDTERMRRAFIRTFGAPPQAIRRSA